jgi:hypothetical protein
VLVAAVPEQRVGQAPAVPPPGLVDLEDHGGQAPGPGLQVLLPDGLQVAQHQVQHPPVAHAGEEELVDVVLLWRGSSEACSTD